jgi:uncharacterized protein (DUF1786 family)
MMHSRSSNLPDHPVLAIDVGAGTQDILLYDPGIPPESCVKLVLPSQSAIVGRKIARATYSRKDIFLHGNLMGGGKSASAVRRHIEAGLRAYATALTAKTIDDNLDRDNMTRFLLDNVYAQLSHRIEVVVDRFSS